MNRARRNKVTTVGVCLAWKGAWTYYGAVGNDTVQGGVYATKAAAAKAATMFGYKVVR